MHQLTGKGTGWSWQGSCWTRRCPVRCPDGGFYDTADDAERLHRPADPTDNATPSGRPPWSRRWSRTPR
jgi:hypothetical protein